MSPYNAVSTHQETLNRREAKAHQVITVVNRNGEAKNKTRNIKYLCHSGVKGWDPLEDDKKKL